MSYLYKELRFQQLKAFCAAVEHGGYTAAAKVTGYSQPTIHQQIDALARHFNTQLLQRRGKGVVPTDDGRLLYDLIKPLVIELDRLTNVFDDMRGRVSGRLRVAAPSSLVYYYLPEKIQTFRREFPKVDMVLINRSGPEIVHMVRAGEVDIGIAFVLDEQPDLQFYPILESQLVVLMPSKHPLANRQAITLAEACEYDQICNPPTTYQRQMIDRMCAEQNVKLRLAMEVVGAFPVQRYVEMGMGLAILPDLFLPHMKNKKLTAIPLDATPNKITRGLLLRSSRHVTASVRAFVNLIDPAIKL